ncbi:hypothetical protein ACP70R_045016 [Stipagrostis hirtigluma subsp. patula]
MEGAARALPLRRGVTLAEQLAASSNLRDLLKLRDDDAGDGHGRLGPGAGGRRRTLLDVIRSAADEDRAPAPGDAGGAGAAAAAATEQAPTAAGARGERVSLMALLERTEQQWAACPGGGQWKRVDGDDGEEEEEAAAAPAEAGKGGGGVGGRCCVCVARGKGAAFIPCGHTFCRACARELRAGRGRCPLCNAAIREVLNLF